MMALPARLLGLLADGLIAALFSVDGTVCADGLFSVAFDLYETEKVSTQPFCVLDAWGSCLVGGSTCKLPLLDMDGRDPTLVV
jgi:hypothetical protein